jgi:hypothetical protein
LGWCQPQPAASEAETFKATAFAFRVFTRVFDPHIVSIQKTVEFMAGLDPNQSLQIGLAKPFMPIFFDGKASSARRNRSLSPALS